MGCFGGGTSVPPPPQPTAEERELQQKQGQAIDYYLNSLKSQEGENKAYQNLLKVTSGLYTPTFGPNGEITGTALDQSSLARLQADAKRNQAISAMELDRYERGLKGELPVSEATKQAKERNFSVLREGLTAKGSNLAGESLDTALATDSAGVENLSRLRKEFALLEDAERRGELSLMRGARTDPMAIGYAGQAVGYGPGATAPGFGQGASLYGQSLQPFQYQRGLEFQGNLQTAANNAQKQAGFYNLIGTGIGTAGSMWALASSKDFKKDIEKISPEEEEKSLSLLSKGNIYRYNYKEESSDKHHHLGYVTEEAPDDIVTDDGKHLDAVSYFGLLTSAVRSLHRKVEQLEEEVA